MEHSALAFLICSEDFTEEGDNLVNKLCQTVCVMAETFTGNLFTLIVYDFILEASVTDFLTALFAFLLLYEVMTQCRNNILREDCITAGAELIRCNA